MGEIFIIGLGPGPEDCISTAAIEALCSAPCRYIQTENHAAALLLKRKGAAYSSMDDIYTSSDDIDSLNRMIVERLCSAAQKGSVAYGVAGGGERLPEGLEKECAERAVQITRIPGVSPAQAALCASGLGAVEGYRVLYAKDVCSALPDTGVPLVLLEIKDRVLAGRAKQKLLRHYSEELPVWFIRFTAEAHIVEKIPLEALDSRREYGTGAVAVMPPVPLKDRRKYSFYDLIAIMDMLRSPGGCPWDREQTHRSLKQYLVEECYETLEAIEQQNDEMLAQELGDVMLQVAFHAQIAKEQARFDIEDVVTAICAKMIARHTHIFGNDRADTPGEVLKNWDRIKKAEKNISTQTQAMRDVSFSLPALMRSTKVQHKAAQVGFDWDKPEGALEKVLEEAQEISEELSQQRAGRGDKKTLNKEVGDLLFAAVNVARLLGVEPEQALYAAVEKFIGRFEYIENEARSMGMKLEGMTLGQMDELWKQAKGREPK